MPNISISGSVVHQNGNPINNILVVANERQMRNKKKLAEVRTQAKGNFSLTLSNVTDTSGYFIEVLDEQGKTLLSQGPFSAKTSGLSLNFVLDDARFKGEILFKVQEPSLAKYVDEWRKGGTEQPITADDARFVAEQTGLPLSETWRWMKAHQLEAETTNGRIKVNAEVVYGLLKQGLPADLGALSALPTGEIENALKKAQDANQISSSLKVPDLIKEWNKVLGARSLNEKPEGMEASLGEILSLAGANAEQQQKMMELFSVHTGSEEQFWSDLAPQIQPATKLASIRKAVQLSVVAGFNTEMVKALLKENTPTNLHAVAALAGKDSADWEAFILAASAQKSAVPAFIKGNSETLRRKLYAAQLAKTLEATAPTQAFFGRLAKVTKSTGFGAAKADLQAFFVKNPGFDFKKANFSVLAEGTGLDLNGIPNPQNLLKELRSASRLMKITPVGDAVHRLRQDGLDSAQAVASMPRSQFTKKYTTVFGSSQAAEQAHQEAEKRAAQVSALLMNARTQSLETAATKGPNPTLRSLFGSLEACDCEHCLSLYSPAAYLTDVLHFLQSRSKPAYDELLRRRPDLPFVLLNCENTNTPLPYVDLVIELLEDEVAGNAPTSKRQSTLSAAELAANPEYSNPEAYNKLKTAVYPASLPFNFALEESRVYLSHLGHSRHQLMEAFFAGKENAAFDDSEVAMEYLGMSAEERDIISAKTKGAETSDAGAWNFFGFNKNSGFEGIPDPSGSGVEIKQGSWVEVLASRVDVLLQQSGLNYVELLALFSCSFINPPTSNPKISIVSSNPAEPTCALNLMRLNGLDENGLTRLYRFLRLSRRLNWSFYDLDKALKAMGISGEKAKAATDYLTVDHLRQLSQIEQLRRELDCTVEEVLVLWYNLGVDAYTDFTQDKPTPIPSLYAQLFRNKAVLNPLNEAFKPNPTTTRLAGTLDDLAPSLKAALRINETEYRLLRSLPALASGALNLENLSFLYRHVALARWTGLSIADLLTQIDLGESQPFRSPTETKAFLRKMELIQSSGFTLAELDYLLRDRFVLSSEIAPSTKTIEDFLAEIAKLPEPSENTLAERFGQTFGLSAKAVELLLINYFRSTINPPKGILNDFMPLVDAPVETLKTAYRKIGKAASLIRKFKISDEELEQILQKHVLIGCLDFNALPLNPVSKANWAGFETLANLIRARDLLGFGTQNLFAILGNALGVNASKAAWKSSLLQRSNWDASALDALIGADAGTNDGGILATEFPEDFRSGALILRIKKLLDLLQNLGLSAAALKAVLGSGLGLEHSKAIKQAAKSKHEEAQWLRIAKPLRDVLRERQRVALLDYAVGNLNKWQSVEELYEYLLIDVEMKPVAMTSRLKQAICSVQLFVDRALMNLELSTEGTPILLEAEQAEEWKTWRKIYRIWEANRKIFLYPENWIEPELRDDQTPFFREATAALLQNELTPETVEDAYRGYLEKLDEVARLEIVGMVQQAESEDASKVLHVFGRTYTQPHQYFHRMLENGEWTPWVKIEADIDSDHLVPVIFNRRLCLFWLFFTQEAEEGPEIDPSKPLPKTNLYWKIQIAWSELRKNSWTGKKLSKSYVQSGHTSNKPYLEFLRQRLFVRHYQGEDGQGTEKLLVHLTPFGYSHLFVVGHTHLYCGASFMFENTSSEPSVIPDRLPSDYSLLLSRGGAFEHEQISSTASALVLQYERINPAGVISRGINEPVLNAVPNSRFKLVIEAGASVPFEQPFVFQDNKNSFFVKTSSYNKASSDALLPDLPDLFLMERSTEQTWRSELQAAGVSPNPLRPRDNPADPREDEIEIEEESDKITKGVLLVTCVASDQFSDKSQPRLPIGIAKTYGPKLVNRTRHQYLFSTFYHPQAKNFIRALNRWGIPGVLRRDIQQAVDSIAFQKTYQPTSAVIGAKPEGLVDFAYGGAYAPYNWELFFHLPMHIACRLSADQRFEEARKWFHYVFDPTTGEVGGKERFWQFRPFYDEFNTLDDLLNTQEELAQQIEKWAAHPFQPHVIARMRITAYMKFTVMKYIENLIAWGDQLFRRDTIESINEATNLYILAAKILGPAPQKIPATTRGVDQSFNDLVAHLDDFSNAKWEDLVSDSSEMGGSPGTGSTSALGSLFYFGVPRNEYLLQYWEKVADRLFKIRHSLNIEGVARSLPLFEPPIDPALLVSAAAAGLDLNSLLNEVNPGVSLYRFAFMLQKANEVVNEVKGLGAALLSALEKRDAEQLSLLRSGHEQHLLKAVLQVRERQVEEAKEMLEGTKKSLESATLRQRYYSSRKRTNSKEDEQMSKMKTGMILSASQQGISALGSIVALVPDFKVGPPTTAGLTAGGSNLVSASRAVSDGLGALAQIFNYQGSKASLEGGYDRRMDDWEFQADQAKTDIEQLKKQVLASEIRLAIASRERSNHQLQMEQSAEADEFMRSKFSNQQLFDWMAVQLSTLYFQTYQMAYDLAKQAEKCLQFELPQTSSSGPGYIQFGYWDNLKKGLLAGEKLQLGLRRLEMAHLEQNKREFEITKHVSLRQINPVAILALRKDGKCSFALPEVLFDMDFPGHYCRRIKSVSISIPCITGPYTGLNATLRLSKNQYRGKAITSDPLIENNLPSSAIAVSNGQNDSGLFELNFRDERYLPFEGAGAISEWDLELPEFRQFDYNTISDVVLHVRYMALEDAGQFKTDVIKEVKKKLEAVKPGLFTIVDLQHDLPNEWHQALQNKNAAGEYELSIPDLQRFLPYYALGKEVKITEVQFPHSPEVIEISTPSPVPMSNIEVKFKTTGDAVQSAFMVIQFSIT